MDRALYGTYLRLKNRFGFRDWWPCDTKDEMIIGAILTQQASWNNVEKAIANLRRARKLGLREISRTPVRTLEKLVRPSGFYKQKSRRLKRVAAFFRNEHPDLRRLRDLDAHAFRKELLSVNGIGKETADSIVLYAAEKPIFVIDAYTRRIVHRLRPEIPEGIDYDTLRQYFESRLDGDVRLYQDFHAQLVELGKRHCKTKPACGKCPLERTCNYARHLK